MQTHTETLINSHTPFCIKKKSKPKETLTGEWSPASR